MRKVHSMLLAKAKGGDKHAFACLKSMAEDDDDDDARAALSELDPGNDGNGADPEDDLDKAEQGNLFDLDVLDRELRALEPFAKGEGGPDVPSAADVLGGQPEIQAAAALDAGDFVKAMVEGNVQALDRLGDGILWNASATEALAKSHVAQGELLHRQAEVISGLKNSMDILLKALTTRGAGLVGAQTPEQLARLTAARRAPVGGGGGTPPAQRPAGGKPGEKDDLQKSLRAWRGAETREDVLGQINDALEDLTVGNIDKAKNLLASRQK
jgi:hypothetical protein